MMRETYPAGPINIERCIQLKWYILKKEVVIEYEVGPLLPYCQAVTDSDQQLQELSKRESQKQFAFMFCAIHMHVYRIQFLQLPRTHFTCISTEC